MCYLSVPKRYDFFKASHSQKRSIVLILRMTFYFYRQVFSSTEFRLSPVPVPYTVEKQVRDFTMYNPEVTQILIFSNG